MTSEEAKKVKTNSVADKIWDSIKDVKIDIYSLPNQTVEMHCEKMKSPPKQLWLKPRSPAVIISLETKFPEFDFQPSVDNRFIIVKEREKEKELEADVLV